MLITGPYHHHGQSSRLANTEVAIISCFTSSTFLHLSQNCVLWLNPCAWQLGNNITLTGLGYPSCKLASIDNTLCAVGAYHPSATLSAKQGVGVRGGVSRHNFFLQPSLRDSAMASEWVFPLVPSLSLFKLSIFLTPPWAVTPVLEDSGFHSAAADLHTPRQ